MHRSCVAWKLRRQLACAHLANDGLDAIEKQSQRAPHGVRWQHRAVGVESKCAQSRVEPIRLGLGQDSAGPAHKLCRLQPLWPRPRLVEVADNVAEVRHIEWHAENGRQWGLRKNDQMLEYPHLALGNHAVVRGHVHPEHQLRDQDTERQGQPARRRIVWMQRNGTRVRSAACLRDTGAVCSLVQQTHNRRVRLRHAVWQNQHRVHAPHCKEIRRDDTALCVVFGGGECQIGVPVHKTRRLEEVAPRQSKVKAGGESHWRAGGQLDL